MTPHHHAFVYEYNHTSFQTGIVLQSKHKPWDGSMLLVKNKNRKSQNVKFNKK